MIAATSAFSAPVPKFMSLWRSPKPVIAQVHGWCGGGGSDMALCADIVIAAEDAQIGTPFGEPLSGKEAAEIGLINNSARSSPFGDYSQGPPSRRPNPNHVIRPGKKKGN